MNAAALHLALNYFPPVLNLAGLCLLVGGLSARSAAVIRTAFAMLLCSGLLAIPVYVSGRGAERIVKPIEGINVAGIEPHEEAATATLVFLVTQAIVALIALLTRRRRALTIIFLLIAMLSSVLVFYTASLGGKIHHPEVNVRG